MMNYILYMISVNCAIFIDKTITKNKQFNIEGFFCIALFEKRGEGVFETEYECNQRSVKRKQSIGFLLKLSRCKYTISLSLFLSVVLK